MALKTFKPVTPSLRQLVIVDRSALYKGKPVKTLTEGKSSRRAAATTPAGSPSASAAAATSRLIVWSTSSAPSVT